MKKLFILSSIILGCFALGNASEIKSDYTESSRCKGHPGDDGYYRPEADDIKNRQVLRFPFIGYSLSTSDAPAIELYYFRGRLYLNWYNITDDCGITFIDTKVEKIADNHLGIHLEVDDSMVADCLCLYDASSCIEGIAPGDYILTLLDHDFNVRLEEGARDMLLINDQYAMDSNLRISKAQSEPCKKIYDREMSIDNPSNEVYYKYATFYDVAYSNGTLKVTWHNLWDNCAGKVRHGFMKRDGDTLKFDISKIYSDEMESCYCVYQASSEFEGIEPGHYTLAFDDNEFEVDLSENSQFDLYPPRDTSKIESTLLDHDMLSLSADKVLTINAQSEYTLDIYNIDGMKMTTLSGSLATELDLNTLPTGAYIISLVSNGKAIHRRIFF